MSFIKDKQIGKIGEGIVINLIENAFQHEVEDVSEDRYWQEVDVDLLTVDPMVEHINYVTGEVTYPEPTKVEVKTDTTNTPNIFFETVSNAKRAIQGNMITSAADVLMYVHLEHKFILSVNLPLFRDWVRARKDTFREVSVRTSNAKGLLIPIERLLDEEDTKTLKGQLAFLDEAGQELKKEEILERIG